MYTIPLPTTILVKLKKLNLMPMLQEKNNANILLHAKLI